MALNHHEKWDGTGYPLGLRGEAIPLEGRITAVADVFDALSSARPYKKAYSFSECCALMEAERGKHFDPRVLDAQNDYDPATFIILDSALSKMKEDDPSRLPFYLEYRGKVIYVLDKIGGEKMIAVRNNILRTIPEIRKFQATAGTVRGIAQRGDLYAAKTNLPNTLTEEQDLVCRTIILLEAAREREKVNNSQGWKAMDQFYAWDEYVLFFGFIS